MGDASQARVTGWVAWHRGGAEPDEWRPLVFSADQAEAVAAANDLRHLGGAWLIRAATDGPPRADEEGGELPPAEGGPSVFERAKKWPMFATAGEAKAALMASWSAGTGPAR